MKSALFPTFMSIFLTVGNASFGAEPFTFPRSKPIIHAIRGLRLRLDRQMFALPEETWRPWLRGAADAEVEANLESLRRTISLVEKFSEPQPPEDQEIALSKLRLREKQLLARHYRIDSKTVAVMEIVRGLHLDKASLAGGMTGNQSTFVNFLKSAVQTLLEGYEIHRPIAAMLADISHFRARQVESEEGGPRPPDQPSVESLYRLRLNEKGTLDPSPQTSGRLEPLDRLGSLPEEAFQNPVLRKNGKVTFSFKLSHLQGPEAGKVIEGHTYFQDERGPAEKLKKYNYASSAPEASQKLLFEDSLALFQHVVDHPELSRRDAIEMTLNAYQKYVAAMPSRRGTAANADLLLATVLYRVTDEILPPPAKVRRDVAALSLGPEAFVEFMKHEYSFLK